MVRMAVLLLCLALAPPAGAQGSLEGPPASGSSQP
jgi:hypothetical protein